MTSCEAPLTLCNGVCRDLQSGPVECGSCGHHCEVNEVCAGGACRCADGRDRCGETCHDLATDLVHCGACGSTCGARLGEIARCVAGRCERTCAAGFVAHEGGCVHAASPLPVAPWSTSRLRTNQPVLRWILPPGAEGAVVELCRQRSCATVTHRLTVRGTTVVTPALAPGPWFWRLRSLVNGATSEAKSATWVLRVLPHARPNASSWSLSGGSRDLNADGEDDFTVDPGTRVVWRREPFAFSAPRAPAVFPSEYRAVLSTDLDGDGFPDLLLETGDGHFGWVRGAEEQWGTFAPLPTLLPTDVRYPRLLWGDLSADGMGDLLVVERDRMSLYLGGPEGLAAGAAEIVQHPALPDDFSSREIAVVGDLDGDGNADLLETLLGAGSPVRYYTRIGFGPVGPAMRWTPTQEGRWFSWWPDRPDTDGDGVGEQVTTVEGDPRSLDVSRVGPDGSTPMTRITLPVDADYAADALPFSGSRGDFDGDGYDDLVVRFGWHRRPPIRPVYRGIYVFPGTRTGPRALPAARLDLYSNESSPIDANHDGIDDLVVRFNCSRMVYLGSPRGLSSEPDAWFLQRCP